MTKAEQARLWNWRFKVLQRAGESSRSVARTCRHFGISRQAFYKWNGALSNLGRRVSTIGRTHRTGRPERPQLPS